MNSIEREQIYRTALAQLKADQDAQLAERIRHIEEVAALQQRAA